ncbi:selenoprotein S [Genypterus blacodes]|uniref:selenoprotein S n=1 Tax=Genypterus blacodes TaxID=154954 RepID=UPI003F777BA4
MDDVEITDVNDDDFPQMEKEPPKNQDLGFLQHAVADVLSLYGWYLLALMVVVYVLIQYLSKRKSSQAHGTTSSGPRTQQDAMLVAGRQEAVEAVRRRMQEELDVKAAEFKEKQKLQEEEKRKQKIEMWDSMKQGKSYKASAKLPQATEEASTSEQSEKTGKKLRTAGYSPLSGDAGSSCAWRPNRRGPSSGG